MMKNTILGITLLALSGFSSAVSAQSFSATNSSIYATMDASNASLLSEKYPTEIKVLATIGQSSAVMLTEKGAEEVHHTVPVHGPGYVYMPSEQRAMKAISAVANRKRAKAKRADKYTITQGELVSQALDLVNNLNIANQIVELENYGTRYHTTALARQAVVDTKKKWEQLANGRTDVSVRLVEHTSTGMPSVVMTVRGSEKPDDFVIMGGHIDSTASGSTTTNAPGADDNASGIATITEIARVLMAMDFKPKRTIEFMAYGAEEVGLRGSNEIAEDYKSRNVNVVSYLQFDMTNYKGSANDVFIYNDTYTSTTLNNFLFELMDTYNASGTHQFTYSTSVCNYGCSDHFSWSQQGYDVSFPSEASFRQSNPNIHTARDTSAAFPTANATHAAKFAKLGLEYMIEIGNGTTTDTGGGTDICDGVAPYNSSVVYNTGDKVTFRGDLYIRRVFNWENVGSCGTLAQPEVLDICAGVVSFNEANQYSVGDKVTFQGNLFERKADATWDNIGACGTTTANRSDNLLNNLIEDNAGFKLYPNPVVDHIITVQVGKTISKPNLLLIDIKGNIVQEIMMTSNEVKLDLTSYAAGVYFVRLYTDSGILNKSFIKK